MKETHILRNVVVWDDRTKHRVEIDVDVEIDFGLISQRLATKAYNSSRRKSRALGSLVEVRVRGTKATPIREKVPA